MPGDRATRCWVEVSLGRIGANFDHVRGVVGKAVEVVPVVKANACGHGAVPVARALCARGARWLAVSSVEEGVALRAAKIDARILVMAGFLPVERTALIDFDLTPVLHSLPAIREWDHLNRVRGRTAAYHLKIDTGLWRLGTLAVASEIAAAVSACSHAQLEGLMTHFASAGDYSCTQTEEQTSRFLGIAAELASVGVSLTYRHLSGTVPVAYGRARAWQNMVRTAHAIYGYIAPSSGPEAPAPVLRVEPALSWKVRILEVKDVPAGAAIGYRGTFRAPAPMRIAILAAGYADGIPHQLANRGQVIAAGRITPMLGAIAMDLTAVDVTHAPGLQPGDAVTLLGSEGCVALDAQQIGQAAGTSSYAILCGIGARVRRVYVE
ncbi:MAG: alanine racemase [Acidobacteriia bacterium]|nr:alanine racemase [Terriglobia bacterium]